MLARALVAVVGLALLTGCNMAAQAQGALSAPQDRVIAAQVDTAMARREARDPQGVLMAIEPATDPQIFNTLSASGRAEVLRLYAWGLSGTNRYDAAETVYKTLAEGQMANGADQYSRLRNASRSGDAAETAETLPLVLAQNDAGGLANPDDVRLVDDTLGGLADPLAARRQLGDSLEDIHWPARTDPLDDGGALVERQTVWLHYAEALVGGNPGRAAKIAGRITRPDLLVALQADRRFDAIIAADPRHFDPALAAQRALTQAQAAVQADPGMLALRITLARAQVQKGDYAAALRVLDEAIALARSGGPPGAVYHDPCPCYATALIWRTVLLAANGRGEAALDALGDIAATQDQDPNNMRLRQARMLIMLDLPKEAEQRMALIDEERLSGYAKLDRAALRACAVAARDARSEAASSLAYLEAHRTADISLFMDAEMCAGDPNRTAAMIIELLKQPAHAASVLYDLQAVPAWPHDYPYRVRVREARAALAARPDVAAAINAVGHARRYDVPRWENAI